MESVKSILKKSFKGTVIEDPVLEPYFITNSAGSFAVSKKRLTSKGTLGFSDICYPSSFAGCLNTIAKEKIHEEGKIFESLKEYIDTWNEISGNIIRACKELNADKI